MSGVVYRERWVVLASFWVVFLLGGLLWISFAPLSSTVRQEFFPVFSETAITMLTAGIPLVFLLFAVPAGIIVDKKGWRFATAIAAVLFILIGVGRAFAPSIEVLLAFQLLLGAAGAFVFSSVSKVVTNWFPLEERGFAQGVATLAQFLGITLGLGLTPPLTYLLGFRPALLVYGVVAIIAGVFFFLKSKEKPPQPVSEAATTPPMREAVSRIFRVKDFWILAFGFLVSFGGYVGLMTFIERIIASNEPLPQKFFEFYLVYSYPQLFYSAVTRGQELFGGVVAATITIGGIMGCIIIPRLSDRVGLRKPFLLIVPFTVIPTLFALGTMSGALLLLAAFFNGFFLLAALPISLEVNVELESIGPPLAGTSVGFLLFFGQAGGVVIPLAMESIFKQSASYMFSLIVHYETIASYMSLMGPLALVIPPPPPIPISGTFTGAILFVIALTVMVLIALCFITETGRKRQPS